LNALILARRDADNGSLSADARQAFANMWALQFRAGDLKGAWAWLNFHNEPWEANSSTYMGATLAAVAVGSAPDKYAASPDIQAGVKLLASFLQRGADTVNLLNRAMLLWASGELQSILTAPQQQTIADALIATQRPDGGWSASALGPYKHTDGSALDSASDGYATGLVTLALERARVSSSGTAVRRGLDWLSAHQDQESGRWMAASLNKARDPATDVGKFMSDAATAYAVLALSSNSR
jgi:squalene-hopene/tetraprenyl-beta-curcumene cyclase